MSRWAVPLRSTERGAPDVIWSFGNAYHFAIEAKPEKGADGFLYKKDLQEAKGHREWIMHNVCPSEKSPLIQTAIVSPTASLDTAAKPFAAGLYYLSTDSIRKFADDCVSGLRKIRSSFSGSEYSEVEPTFAAEVRAFKMDFDSVLKFLTASSLTP